MNTEKIALAHNRLRTAPLWGRQMAQLFTEISYPGNVDTHFYGGSGVSLRTNTSFAGRRHEGFLSFGIVRGDGVTVAILKMEAENDEESAALLSEGILSHPERVAVVQTGYFNRDGQPLDPELVAQDKMDDLAHVLAISGNQGRWGRISEEGRLYQDIADRTRELVHGAISGRYIFYKD